MQRHHAGPCATLSRTLSPDMMITPAVLDLFGRVCPPASDLPAQWVGDLAGEWSARRGDGGDIHQAAHASAWLWGQVQNLQAMQLGLDASDSELCRAAEELATKCASMRQLHQLPLQRDFWEEYIVPEAMARVCKTQGVEPPKIGKLVTPEGAAARMSDDLWWRRKLRAVYGRAVEVAAIELGRVSKTREIYASNQTCERRAQQIERNTAAMEATTAVNELGQEFTLAELAAKGPSNKAIRRAELMTRIAGFERIAQGHQHAGLFLTMTCPSRMHKMRMAGRDAVPNPKYDGTNPREAGQYLGKVWARIRAKLHREGVKLYGFRIAEPQHDGTPHWHMLVFHESGHGQIIRDVVRAYALADSGTERGAAEHRCDFKAIDAEKGTAAGYIAKYVSKNIDGYRVETDLHGNDCITASQRVEAWATTWGIRQFQQIGGPPVGPWRELRRVESVPENAPQYMQDAWSAVNKLQVIEGRELASVSWDRYVKAQGGVFCGRRYRVRVAMRQRHGETNRYREQACPVAMGVECVERELYKPAHMQHIPSAFAERTTLWIADSVRHTWAISRGTGSRIGAGAERLPPRTRVNNCTAGTEAVQAGRSEMGEKAPENVMNIRVVVHVNEAMRV